MFLSWHIPEGQGEPEMQGQDQEQTGSKKLELLPPSQGLLLEFVPRGILAVGSWWRILGYPWCSVGSKSPLRARGGSSLSSCDPAPLGERGEIPWKSSRVEVKTGRPFPNDSTSGKVIYCPLKQNWRVGDKTTEITFPLPSFIPGWNSLPHS